MRYAPSPFGVCVMWLGRTGADDRVSGRVADGNDFCCPTYIRICARRVRKCPFSWRGEKPFRSFLSCISSTPCVCVLRVTTQNKRCNQWKITFGFTDNFFACFMLFYTRVRSLLMSRALVFICLCNDFFCLFLWPV